MSSNMSASDVRLYFGPNLPRDTERTDVERLFKGYGDVREVKLMSGYGFVEFSDPRDAKDAVNDFSMALDSTDALMSLGDGKEFRGERINVEFARASRRREYDERGPPRERESRFPRPRRTGNRVLIEGLSPETSWQASFRDFMREAGEVTFSDVPRDRDGRGVVEYDTADDMKKAIETLHGKECKGIVISVKEDPNPLDDPPFSSRVQREDRFGGGRGGYSRDRSPRRDYGRRDYDRGSYRREEHSSRRDDSYSARRDEYPPSRRDDGYSDDRGRREDYRS
ncbi:Pre-mRNA-splicing factor srp2 [Neolecta irregularis DAH-3]|uniref:Pre-mRNA-splicing factor srp2 n=1 Tax=Neolecta irregularis (strain DAH-3) TaxID=1198029 RepID=A0A1U7LUN3_NEOID|nr:Pre-mRNA-splicing factor srp2 [Neolecta irregularis DAH-3]|eukprot:OLL26252.1 Pre-mRNA-splicing factor srp2 [Neolecta irregularis DAH-3]